MGHEAVAGRQHDLLAEAQRPHQQPRDDPLDRRAVRAVYVDLVDLRVRDLEVLPQARGHGVDSGQLGSLVDVQPLPHATDVADRHDRELRR